MIGECERSGIGVEKIRLEELEWRAEELMNVPGHEIDAFQRVADVGDRIRRLEGFGIKGSEEEEGIEKQRYQQAT